MKVGTVCYATDSGLGILTKAFFDNGIVTDPVVVRHGRHPTHDDWYPGAYQVTDLRSRDQWDNVFSHLGRCDVVLFFETPFEWKLIPQLQSVGIKTFLMTMYECTPDPLPAIPDVFLCPSMLDRHVFGPPWADELEPFTRCFGLHGVWAYRTPVPVAVPWRKRTRAEVFVHNAGHGGLKGRNGTAELLEALEYVKSPAKFIIRSQEDLYRTGNYRQISQLGNLPVRRGQTLTCDEDVPPEKMVYLSNNQTVESKGLYDGGDVFVFPEKFNGLSLPLQEAYGSGMAVMATDRFPNNTYLPGRVHDHSNDGCPLNDLETYCNQGVSGLRCSCPSPLIPVASTRKARIGPPYMEFAEAVIDPRVLAAKIDEWYGRDISALSEMGRVWAEENSWAKLGPKYREVLSK